MNRRVNRRVAASGRVAGVASRVAAGMVARMIAANKSIGLGKTRTGVESGMAAGVVGGVGIAVAGTRDCMVDSGGFVLVGGEGEEEGGQLWTYVGSIGVGEVMRWFAIPCSSASGRILVRVGVVRCASGCD